MFLNIDTKLNVIFGKFDDFAIRDLFRFLKYLKIFKYNLSS